MENRIKDILSEKGSTAKELSSVIGLSSVSLYNIINGKQEASANTLNAIATALNVPFWQLSVSEEVRRNKRRFNLPVRIVEDINIKVE